MRAFLLAILVIVAVVGRNEGSVRRDEFPNDFVFGAGTSAYQWEGAAAVDGRTPAIWDTSAPEGNTASDGYHKYKEDVWLMKQTGLQAYRFSISWSRLIPDGRGKVNLKGLQYYNNLINELISHGIAPHITLLHFDTPQVLEDEYGGLLSPKIVDDFTAYADVCFREFGDRVLHWTTINEPNMFAFGGYDLGTAPPHRCSHPYGNCSAGDSSVEPYIVAHNALLAHSSAASLYKKNYQGKQKGFIGLNLMVLVAVPETNSTADFSAAKRVQEFFTGWIVEPLLHGDYPQSMRKAAGKKMPRFSWEQSEQLMNSFDFIGVNNYHSIIAWDSPSYLAADQRDFLGDIGAYIPEFCWTNGGERPVDIPVNSQQPSLRSALEYLKQTYGNPPIYVQENGYGMINNATLNDTPRVNYMSKQLEDLHDALRNGCNIKGYFTWSFVDAIELVPGYNITYGLYYVDFEDKERKRYTRLSAQWYSNFLEGRGNNDIYIYNSSSYGSQIA